jgi:hypothetical protein
MKMKIKVATTNVVEKEIDFEIPSYRKSKHGFNFVKITEHGFIKIYDDSSFFQQNNRLVFETEFNSMINESIECTE